MANPMCAHDVVTLSQSRGLANGCSSPFSPLIVSRENERRAEVEEHLVLSYRPGRKILTGAAPADADQMWREARDPRAPASSCFRLHRRCTWSQYVFFFLRRSGSQYVCRVRTSWAHLPFGAAALAFPFLNALLSLAGWFSRAAARFSVAHSCGAQPPLFLDLHSLQGPWGIS